MFVRIVYDDGREVLRHCKEVSMVHLFAEDTESEDALMLTCDDSFADTDHVSYVVPKKGADIYFMNDQGKTVDSYQWISDDGGAKAPPSESES